MSVPALVALPPGAMKYSGIVWAVVRFHSEFMLCLPGVVCCLIGGSLAGVLAATGAAAAASGHNSTIMWEEIPIINTTLQN